MNPIFKSVLVKSSIALACLSASNTFANDIEEIVITAKGNQTVEDSLFTTHVFNEFDIEAAQVEDIPALLDRLAGVSVVDSGGRGSLTNVFVRGASNSQTLVLVDGIRVGSATTGSASLNSYPIESIERIEVVKGPFSGIYGADAAAGVINIFTKKYAGNKATLTASFGSDGLQEYGVFGGIGNDKHSLTVALNYEDSTGFSRRDSADPIEQDRDGFSENAISVNGKTTLNDYITASLSVLYSDSLVDIDSGTSQSESDDENLNVVLNVETNFTDNFVWKNALGLNKNEAVGNETDFREFAFDPDSVIDSVFSTRRKTLNSEFFYSFNNNANITFGADYYRENIGRSTTDFTDTSRNNTGLYAQLIAKDEIFSLVTSIRYDDNSDYGSDTNRSIAIGYNINENLQLSGSFGTAFIAPSFNDLYFPSSFFSGFGFFPDFVFTSNPEVQPEESESYEVNFSGNYDYIDWVFSVYRTDYDNLISSVSEFDLAANTIFSTVDNVESARIDGYELSLNTSIASWEFGLNINVLDSENLTTEERLANLAEETLNFSVSKSFGKFDFTTNLKFEHDRYENSNGGLNRLPSYAVYDIRANYLFSDKISISAKIENLFDKDYAVDRFFDGTDFNTGGRLAQVTLKYNF